MVAIRWRQTKDRRSRVGSDFDASERDWYRTEDGDWEREVELDAGRMIHVTLPDEYPSELLTQVVRDLSEIDPDLTPPWVMEHWAGQPPQ